MALSDNWYSPEEIPEGEVALGVASDEELVHDEEGIERL